MHPSYDKLVALGLPAVPLIMEWYQGIHLEALANPGTPLSPREYCHWGLLLEDITQIQFINRYCISDILEKSWFSWWESVWSDEQPTT